MHDSGDGHPRIPEAEEAGEGDESGRGLLLVEALADKWGVAGREPGKIVWCEFVDVATPASVTCVMEPDTPGRMAGGTLRT